MYGIVFVGSDGPPGGDWVLWKRTATTEVYKNTVTGEYQRTIGQGIQFIDDKTRGFPNYVPFNETFFSLTNSSDLLYDYELDQYYEPGWNVYFKSNPTSGQVVKYIVNNTEITFQPMPLNYRNDLDQIQQIKIVQEVVGINQTNRFTYPDAYGTGIDLNYENKLGIMKENLVIDSFSRLPAPLQYILDGGNATLDLDFIIETNSKMIINGVEWDKKNVANTQGQVLIQNTSGQNLYKLPVPVIRDSNNSEIIGKYQFKKQGNSLYVIIKTPYSWLENAVYPVYIDPTIVLQDADTENLKDTFAWEEFPNSNRGNDIDMNVGKYNGYQQAGYITFNLSSLYEFSIANISNTNLFLDNYGGIGVGGTFNYSVYHIYNDWVNGTGNNVLNEDQLTWNNQPCGVNFDNSTNCNLTYTDSLGLDNQDGNWNVTNIIQTDYSLNRENSSFFIRSENLTVGEYIRFVAKEASSGIKPYLNITYTPYINIISPTSGSSYNYSSVGFNISTATDMDTCYWTNNSGTTNNTMNKINSTYFENSSSKDDGDYQLEFYCNQSSGGTWRTSDSISFTIDANAPQISITTPSNNTNTTNTNLDVNYTVSDTNLDSCWYSNDTMTVNKTLGSCANITVAQTLQQ
jgi:hypothetical protein